MPAHSVVLNKVCPQGRLVNQGLACWSITVFMCAYCVLCNPVDCVARLAPLSKGFPRQEYWSGFPVPFPNRGIEPAPSALACRFFTTEPPGNPTLVLAESNQRLTHLEERKYPTLVHSSHSVPPKRAEN